GGLLGLLVGWTGWLAPPPPPPLTWTYPLPHHVPRQPDGVALRFAMVHDVLHDRFPRHGMAYYAERNRLTRQRLDRLKAGPWPAGKPPADYFPLLDDLAVGLAQAGEPGEALGVLRDKLRQQLQAGQEGRELYPTYANLGAVLLLGPLRQARPGNAED